MANNPFSAFSDYLSTLLFFKLLILLTMADFKFKLIKSISPVIKGRSIVIDSNVGGTKNTYKVYRMSRILGIKYWKYIGKRTFLRPYQSLWNHYEDRLPAVYWGKGPLTNLWLVLYNDFDNISNIKTFLPESTTRHFCAQVFEFNFNSHELVKNLKSNKTFYQSNFENHGKRKQRSVSSRKRSRIKEIY